MQAARLPSFIIDAFASISIFEEFGGVKMTVNSDKTEDTSIIILFVKKHLSNPSRKYTYFYQISTYVKLFYCNYQIGINNIILFIYRLFN